MTAPAAAPLARSWRHWAPRLAVVIAAVAIGLALQRVLAEKLLEIDAQAARDVFAARRELAFVLRVVGGLVFGLTTAVGVALLVASFKAIALGVFPPPGLWSWGSLRSVEGPRARQLAAVSVALATVLVVCSLAGLGLILHMAQRLLACPIG